MRTYQWHFQLRGAHTFYTLIKVGSLNPLFQVQGVASAHFYKKFIEQNKCVVMQIKTVEYSFPSYFSVQIPSLVKFKGYPQSCFPAPCPN
jgi:hypothetical protein